MRHHQYTCNICGMSIPVVRTSGNGFQFLNGLGLDMNVSSFNHRFKFTQDQDADYHLCTDCIEGLTKLLNVPHVVAMAVSTDASTEVQS